MTVPATHCEARKVAYRQSREGLVVSFVIHPNDMPDALAVAPLGQRYMLAMAPIGDDEQPIVTVEKRAVQQDPNSGAKSQQAASQRGKDHYARLPPMGQARDRAVMLAKDERFQSWIIRTNTPDAEEREQTAAEYIRNVCCGGKSRGLIAEDPECYQRFLILESDYKQAVGLATEMRSW